MAAAGLADLPDVVVECILAYATPMDIWALSRTSRMYYGMFNRKIFKRFKQLFDEKIKLPEEVCGEFPRAVSGSTVLSCWLGWGFPSSDIDVIVPRSAVPRIRATLTRKGRDFVMYYFRNVQGMLVVSDLTTGIDFVSPPSGSFEDTVRSYDLSVCMNYFHDGELFVAYPEHILRRQCIVFERSTRQAHRLVEYLDRGFTLIPT